MKKTTAIHRLRVSAIAITAIALMGCGGGDGGGGEGIGSSSITGTVESFEGTQVAAGLVGAFTGVVRGGVQVQVVGTDLSSTTADDGFFVISGVPAGARTLRFAFQGSVANYQVNVPENAQITVSQIRIRNGEVSAGPMQVRQTAPPPASTDHSSSSSSSDDSRSSNDDSPSSSSSSSPSSPFNDEVEVRGPIQALSGGSILVAGRTFRIVGSTAFLDRNNQRTRAAAFSVGQLVEVEGDIVGGQLQARKVKREDGPGDDRDDDHDRNRGGDDDQDDDDDDSGRGSSGSDDDDDSDDD